MYFPPRVMLALIVMAAIAAIGVGAWSQSCAPDTCPNRNA